MVTMNSKVISLFSSTLLLLIVLLPLLSCATSPESHDQKKSAFEFLNHLLGCHHGEKVKGIHDLKKYLEHFDEQWSVGAQLGAINSETVALYEIGHLLGLWHSSVGGAIMFPNIPSGVTKGLHPDDIQEIKALYNT
ncbi:Metalloendoproteinase 1 [Morella rubra]|uniref:Metalloendoproteinase 1 n=1 Tax=Morella rubra TaxID=262757 RepID=A0A6A1UY63_9ROSI|nr:Metalloendoproteinase 1 [Morella rubra]